MLPKHDRPVARAAGRLELNRSCEIKREISCRSRSNAGIMAHAVGSSAVVLLVLLAAASQLQPSIAAKESVA